MKEAGCRLLIVGYESGDPQILRTSRRAPTVERARQFTKDCKKLKLLFLATSSSACPARPRKRFAAPSTSPRNWTSRPFRFLWLTLIREPNSTTTRRPMASSWNEGAKMVDEGGHQVAMIEYPGLPRDYVMEMVHGCFYDEYYFRPKAIFRIVRESGLQQRRTQASVQGSHCLHEAACGA